MTRANYRHCREGDQPTAAVRLALHHYPSRAAPNRLDRIFLQEGLRVQRAVGDAPLFLSGKYDVGGLLVESDAHTLHLALDNALVRKRLGCVEHD